MDDPGERMKGGRAHEVPLGGGGACAAPQPAPVYRRRVRILLPTAGAKPVNGFSKAKVRIDKLSGVNGLGDPRSAADNAHTSLRIAV